MKKIIYIITSLCLILNASCTRRPTVAEKQVHDIILQDTTCEPPCWHGISPGKTTKQEALLILKSLPFIQSGSLGNKGGPWNGFSDVIFFYLPNGVKNETYLLNDTVALIDFVGDLGITFGEAVEKYGEPQFIIHMVLITNTRHHFLQTLRPSNGTGFLYDDNDMPVKVRGELRPENKIRYIDLFDPNAYEALLETGLFLQGYGRAAATKRAMQPWTGYGNIAEKYPP